MMNLCDISGQDAAVGRLIRMLAGARRPHAYIFCGPEGVGRRTTAEAVAGVLLCESPVEAPNGGRFADLPAEATIPTACGRCVNCMALEAGTHGDFHAVSRQSGRYSANPRVRASKMQELSIDVIREFVIEPSMRAAGRGRGRVFIIREAELMNNASQNALLKTLEEPPAGVTLILICRSPEDLLPTTRSRCALVRFAPLPTDFVADRLRTGGVEAAEATFWARFTEGSLGRSLRLAETELYAFKRSLVGRLAALSEALDAELGDDLAKQTDDLAAEAVRADKQLALTLARRQASGIVLGLLASVYRDAMAAAAGARGRSVHADQADSIERIGAVRGAAGCAEIVAQMARYEQLLWRNVNPKTLWDNVVITCATGAPLDV